MNRSRRRTIFLRNVRKPWHPRACVRREVTLRVDYATAQGRLGLGLVRNLSLQGMYIENASRQVVPEVAPGDLLTVAFVLPSGRPCKLPVVVVHGNRHGWGVRFREGHPQALANLTSYWTSLEGEAPSGKDLDYPRST
jgi:PilZ domain